MDLPPAAVLKASFIRDGYAGPIPLLTSAECALLRNYARSGELAEPLTWFKGLAPRDQLIYGLATRPQLLQWLSELLGPHVYLWGAQFIEKNSGEAHAWHTDVETSLPNGRFVSVWIGVENTSSKSALQYISGSHLIGKSLQQVAHERQVDRSDRTAALALSWAKSARPDAALVAADVADGDAILFDGRIWHGSLNIDDKPRRALLLQYAAANQKVRMPDNFDWPFAYKAEPPPAITVLGRAKGYGNLVDPPRDEPLERPLLAAVKAVPDGNVWTPHPVMNGRPKSVGRLAVHFSLLQPGHSPHAPHAHVDEEILIVIDGEAEVVLPKSQEDPSPDIHRLRPGDFTYFPAYHWHTIRNTSTEPIVYLMLKWCGAALGFTAHAPSGVFRREGLGTDGSDQPFQTQPVLEGATHFLSKLHVHRSLIMPGGGYEPHADPYDVTIVLLDGTVRTMRQTMTAPAFFYHPAGSLHGIRALGDRPASYLVVELHGSSDSGARKHRRTVADWSMADEFTATPGRSWKAWRVSRSV
jgi:mannose-6-phosphate isomerase-like protein (cupin superfamily)